MAAQVVAEVRRAYPFQITAGVLAEHLPGRAVVYKYLSRAGKSRIPHKISSGRHGQNAIHYNVARADHRAGIVGLGGTKYGKSFYFRVGVRGCAVCAQDRQVVLGTQFGLRRQSGRQKKEAYDKENGGNAIEDAITPREHP